MHIYINKKNLSYRNYKVKCAIGKRGIGIKKEEGDLITPKGTFRIQEIFYRKDKLKNFTTKISKKAITKNMGWCDDPSSKKYNKLIKYPFKFSSEKFFRSDDIYDLILVLNFNSSPIIKGKGSAIFIHIAKKKFSPTIGCIAINKFELIKVAKLVDKKTIIKIF